MFLNGVCAAAYRQRDAGKRVDSVARRSSAANWCSRGRHNDEDPAVADDGRRWCTRPRGIQAQQDARHRDQQPHWSPTRRRQQRPTDAGLIGQRFPIGPCHAYEKSAPKKKLLPEDRYRFLTRLTCSLSVTVSGITNRACFIFVPVYGRPTSFLLRVFSAADFLYVCHGL